MRRPPGWAMLAAMRTRTSPRLPGSLRARAALAETYGAQLDDIARVLVKAGVLTRADVRRHGVRFAVHAKFEAPAPKGLPRAAVRGA